MTRGLVEDRAGKPIMGATVELYFRNTTKPVLAATVTDSEGHWEFSDEMIKSFKKPLDTVIITGSERRRMEVKEAE